MLGPRCTQALTLGVGQDEGAIERGIKREAGGLGAARRVEKKSRAKTRTEKNRDGKETMATFVTKNS